MHGTVGGHSGYSVSTLKQGVQDAVSYYKKDLPKEDGLDKTDYIGVYDYANDIGYVVYCTPSYLKNISSNMFQNRGDYDAFVSACKTNMLKKKPVEYHLGA